MITPFHLETPRLLLRPFLPKDGPDMYALNADPEVIRYTGDGPFESPEAATQFLTDYPAYREYGYGRWIVIEKSTGKTLGWCGLKFLKEVGETDLGYRFFQEHWGKGFAQESSRVCLDYGFHTLNLASIRGNVVPENVRSVHVLEKMGMQWEAAAEDHGGQIWVYRVHNPDPLHVRTATSADVPALRELYQTSVKSQAPKYYTPEQVEAWASSGENGLTWERLSSQQVWIAESAGCPAGFISLKTEGYLDLLYVGAGFQRRAVASRLLYVLEREALSQELLRLETHASLAAVPFFEARGYRVVRANEAIASGVAMTNYLMETSLMGY